MALERIARMLERRPPPERFRDQLFWLVDLVYACKSSGNSLLAEHASIVEEALGRFGEFIQTGDKSELDHATARVEEFARVVKSAVAADKVPP